ncbi:MAG: D-threonine aldolase [Chloroflexota bacterium]|jgi:D-serine deaminase-like pyridoxal phosphate-dependent protein|nr:D-threonine aldolase [Chloroflexota bacterium]
MSLPGRIPTEVAASLESPGLVIDIAAAKANIDLLDARYAGSAVKVRPHFKAHKSLDLMRLQLESPSAIGATCATVSEAMALARDGVRDVLIANQVIEPAALATLDRLSVMTDLRVAVDDVAHVELLAGAPSGTIGVLLEVDVGNHRCGIDPNSPELEPLVERIAMSPGLRFDGLMGYEGHAVLERDRTVRSELVVRAAAALDLVRRRLDLAGFPCSVVSGGGTGTFDLAADTGTYTEIQAGSYVLMDATYAGLDLPFGIALYCFTRVLSARSDRGVANAGLKVMSAEQGMPQMAMPAGSVTGLADEHARLVADGLRIGQGVWLVPSHVDPTVAMHDVVAAWDDETGLHTWHISRDDRHERARLEHSTS